MAGNHIIRAFGPNGPPPAPYEFQEYPKHIYPDGPGRNARFIVVNSEEEEAEVLATGTIEAEDDARERMMAIVAQRGLKIDKRWGLGKISAAIEAAGYDPSANPFA